MFWVNRTQNVANIGVVFGQRTQRWWALPFIESFQLLRDVYRITESDYQKTNHASAVPWPKHALRRCGILVSRPGILFLDEPTIGLDATSKIVVCEFIKYLNRVRNVTVILTSHDMADIKALCHRIIVIGNGVTLSDGCLSDLRPKLMLNVDSKSSLRIKSYLKIGTPEWCRGKGGSVTSHLIPCPLRRQAS